MVPKRVWPVCDKGVKPSQLRSLSYSETVIMGEHMCTRMDKVLAVNFDPFGACACCNGSPCTAPVIDWTHVTDKIRLGGNLLLLENSELLCSLGGRIRIFYTLAAASAACGASREEERSFWSKAIDFGKGLGKGLWKGLKGTVTGVIDLGIWAGKHSLPYMLLDPAGFADQLKQDGEILKSLGNLAGKAGTWIYRNSAVNLLANPQDFLAAQQENRAMLETLADKAANMSAEEWGDFAGQVLFEVGTEVATAGGAAALTAVKVADKVVDVAKIANKADDFIDAAKALDKLDDAAMLLKHWIKQRCPN
ncbi:PAAR-like protein [Tannerella forsythia]|uniref:PAAR-like protein n=1 Tax=Tannerella forsythia TaxID=28112 RepID=UPI0028EFDE3B|nr:PAAR-like protein [Tannerella forsythia]